MRLVFATVMLLAAAGARAANMIPVPGTEGLCGARADETAICHEWKLVADPTVRLLATGYEDGVQYTFEQRDRRGRYKTIVLIYPVMPDPGQAGSHVWAYAWDIEDVEVDAHGWPLATFAHKMFDDGEVYPPKWQKRIPAVLFRGKATQHVPQEGPLTFAPMSLRALRRAAAHR